MRCTLKDLGRAIRFTIFPMSKIIEERTKEIDQKMAELRSANQATSEEVNKVTQPDVLRSLVISMNKAAVRKRK